MKYYYKIKKDIIEWDIINWWKFIEKILNNNINLKNKEVLEFGARNGGLSLFYGLNNANVLCSDVRGSFSYARQLHKKYRVDQKITYKIIDATDVSDEYNEKFDIITFKSVLGGIGSLGNNKQKKMIACIKRCLRPGGLVIFADNMQASSLHSFFRTHFREHGRRWHYESEQDILELFSEFELCDKSYCGVIGCFGLNEKMRNFFGRLDTLLFDRICPDKWKYIGIFIYRKPINNEL